ncbi:hypothetical protein BVC80_657g2 [Macleaya cordata]|uniref:Uncharacterized protein n=1 Tax=Macleaya cordata TaxID=56857 RepID=A0A200PRV5_MACCD|nr:hypothetical protein BVC80_657g2 [Macleaya cordata]
MDDNRQHENGRHKQDHYKLLQSQWMFPPHLMKGPHALTMKFMSIFADREEGSTG